MRRGVSFAMLGVLLARPGAAETDVRKAGDRLDVRATTAPLSEVLDRLARETGMKVTYDGPPPRGRVSLALSGVTPVQAVMSLLEGQGLNYALRMDPTSTRIDTLMIVGNAGSSGPAPAPAGRTARGAMERDREADAEPADEDAPPAEVTQPTGEEGQPRRGPTFPPVFPGGALPNGPAMPLTLPTPGPMPPGMMLPGMNPAGGPAGMPNGGPPTTLPNQPQPQL